MTRGPATGARLGRSLSDILANTLTSHKAASAPIENEMKAAYLTAFMEKVERELAPHLTGLLGGVVDDEHAPDWLRDLAGRVTAPGRQVDAILGIISAIFGIFGITSRIAQLETQSYMNHLWAQTPVMPLPAELLAVAVLKGVLSEADAAAEASETGIGPTRFSHMIATTGEPLGLEELLFLYRRGKIDQPTLAHGIRQSRVRDEWIDAAINLRYHPLDVGTAVAAAVQNQLPYDTAKQKAAENGLDPADFDAAYRTHGRPPGIAQMADLWNRGKATQAEFDQAVRESDIKDKYVTMLEDLRRYIPPPRTVTALLKAGAITVDRAHQFYVWNGLDAQTADEYITGAKAEKHQANKELALSQIVASYTDRNITRAKAGELLAALGWDAEDQGFILDIADDKRTQKFHEGAISTVHARYVGYRIERVEASRDLDALAVPAAQRDDLIRLWDLERGANQRDLTEGEIAGLVARGLVTPADGVARLQHIGYAQADAELLIAYVLTPVTARAPTPKHLTRTDVVKAFSDGAITYDDAKAELQSLGYSSADAEFILNRAKQPAAGA